MLLLYSSIKNISNGIVNDYLEQEIVNKEKIDEGVILKYNTLIRDTIKISLEGGITPVKASQDNLELKLEMTPAIGLNIIETGSIEVNYADYEIHEDGYSLPTYGDDLYVNLKSVTNVVLNIYTDTEDLLNEIQFNIDNVQI